MIKMPEPPHLSLYLSDDLVETERDGYEYKNIICKYKTFRKEYKLKIEVEQWCIDTLSGKWSLNNSKIYLGVSNKNKIPLHIYRWEIKFEKISDLIVFRLKWL
jgi:hypothetical protein